MIYKAQLPKKVLDTTMMGLPIAARHTATIEIGDRFQMKTWRKITHTRETKSLHFVVDVEVVTTGADYIEVRDTAENNWEANGVWVANHQRGITTRLDKIDSIHKCAAAGWNTPKFGVPELPTLTELRFEFRRGKSDTLILDQTLEISPDYADEMAQIESERLRVEALHKTVPSLGSQMKEAQRMRGWNDDELAKVLGWSRKRVRAIMGGDERANQHEVSLIAAALGPIQADIDRWVGQEPLHVQLRARRESLGITQAELAERVGTTQGRIGDWERNSRTPGIEWLRRLASELGSFVVDGESERERAVRERAMATEWWKTDWTSAR